MKTMSITAVMALLMAIPFILRKKELQPLRIENRETETTDENQRYDIDEFLT